MSTVMKNIMTTMSMNITNIATMNIALVGMNTTTTMNMIIMDTAITIITNMATMNIAAVGMTMKKKIAVCVGTITMGTVMMNIMTTVPVDMTTTSITDTIIQAAAANIITAPQKRW